MWLVCQFLKWFLRRNYCMVDYKYGYRKNSLCCEHNWEFDSKWTGCSVSCYSVCGLDRIFFYDSFLVIGRGWYLVFFLLLELHRLVQGSGLFFSKRSPFSLFFFYLNERVLWENCVLLSLMMTSPAMLLLQWFWPSIVLSHSWDGLPDFWRWVDTWRCMWLYVFFSWQSDRSHDLLSPISCSSRTPLPGRP